MTRNTSMVQEKPETEYSRSDGGPGKLVLKAFIVLAALIGLYAVSQNFGHVIDIDSFQDFVKQAGPWAPIVFMAVYLIGPTIFLPASVLTMAGGAMFGPVMGTLYTIVSATLGATIPFLITRHFGRAPLDRLLARNENFDQVFKKFDRSVAEQGWKYVAFTRLVTLFPFLILNYAYGLTRVRLWTYMWASFVFMLPGSFMFNYIGFAGREALRGGEGIVKIISIAVGCVILLTALPGLAKRFWKVGDS